MAAALVMAWEAHWGGAESMPVTARAACWWQHGQCTGDGQAVGQRQQGRVLVTSAGDDTGSHALCGNCAAHAVRACGDSVGCHKCE